MHFDDRLADGESKTKSFPARPNLLERFENPFEMFRFNADAGVANFDRQSLRLGVGCPDSHSSLGRGEFRGVS